MISIHDSKISVWIFKYTRISMKKYFKLSLFIFALIICSFVGETDESISKKEQNIQHSSDEPVILRFDADVAVINSESSEIVDDNRLSNNKGMTLKPGVAATVDGERTEPDLIFNVKVPEGRYVINTFAVTDDEGTELMKKAKGKFESLFMKMQIDDQRPTKRVVYVPWNKSEQESGKFDFNGDDQKLKIWLPRGVRLEYIQLSSYVPPIVPELYKNYQPKIIPPAHPRLWVTRQSLPMVKERLEVGENLAAWEKVKESALIPLVFKFNFDKEMAYNAELERAAETKAFYYLMAGDKHIGREAIELMANYLSLVEFGNVLDITREIGRAIYTASEVYDWCYDLLTVKEKQIFCDNLMRFSEDMEIGWPPFKQTIVNGHGNEAQINRDLLAMSIAIYDENPLPYQYCSYRELEELVPMRNWQYQSPRHDQGVDYGAYRMGWEMHAVWLFYRMTGRPVFGENIKNISRFFLYMRLPDGQMLRDGDGFVPNKEDYYWSYPQTMFLLYTYANDPIVKAEFERQGGLAENPVLFLLLNDPKLKPEPTFDSLPLTIDFGSILGSMIARTGWHIGENSNDVVVEIKGGGCHFGNHKHSDAGAIQIYYRGIQVGDLGIYGFYGTPYDYNFNKRSISHSMVLVRDPEEKFGDTESNDGGTRFNQRVPKSKEEAESDPRFNNGKVISANFGPSKLHPFFSYFSVDLAGAYSSKIKTYTRSSCFLNLDRDDIPAAIILSDDITTDKPEFKKYWQINTLNMPELTKSGVILKNERQGLVGKTHVEMLIPSAAERNIDFLSGSEANSSFGFMYDVPESFKDENRPEIHGHRIIISPKTANKQDRFLTVFQLTAGDTKPMPVIHYETMVSNVVYLADRVVSMSKSSNLIDTSYTLKIPKKGKYQVVLTGMESGNWNVVGKNNKIRFNTNVTEGKNTICFFADSGEYVVSPGRIDGAKVLIMNENSSSETR